MRYFSVGTDCAVPHCAPENCVDVLDNPNVGERANVYSCGKDKDQPSNVEGVLWWTTGVGCKDKEAGPGVQTWSSSVEACG